MYEEIIDLSAFCFKRLKITLKTVSYSRTDFKTPNISFHEFKNAQQIKICKEDVRKEIGKSFHNNNNNKWNNREKYLHKIFSHAKYAEEESDIVSRARSSCSESGNLFFFSSISHLIRRSIEVGKIWCIFLLYTTNKRYGMCFFFCQEKE